MDDLINKGTKEPYQECLHFKSGVSFAASTRPMPIFDLHLKPTS
ncbi:MAG: hypothetical protein R2772_08505 [Chitinophagales bacterium]